MHDPGTVPPLAELADRMAILEVLALHSRGVDRADEASLRAAYWPDAEVEYGGFNGNAHAFCAILPGAIRTYAATQHAVSNTLITFAAGAGHDGAVAEVESCVTASHLRRNDTGADVEMVFLGRYLDRMERRGDAWKISRRRVVMDWNRWSIASSVDGGPPFAGLARGARHPDDPLDAVLAALAGSADG